MASNSKPTGPMSRKTSPTNTRRVVKGGERKSPTTTKLSNMATSGTGRVGPSKPGGVRKPK